MAFPPSPETLLRDAGSLGILKDLLASELERAGRIRNLVQQPRFHFVIDGRQVVDDRGRALRFTPDFGFDEASADGWVAVVEDVKSVATMTEAATLRMAFFRATHPRIKLRIVA